MASATTPSDADLLARIQTADQSALGDLLARHAEDLHHFAYLTLHDSALAKDVVQDVFVSLWNRRADLVITGNVASYLFRAVRNRALNVAKHEQSQARIQGIIAQAYLVDAPAGYNDGELQIRAEEFNALIQRAIDTLSPRIREIFLMHRVQGLSYSEIAEILEVTQITVQSQISRAIKHIAEYLDAHR